MIEQFQQLKPLAPNRDAILFAAGQATATQSSAFWKKLAIILGVSNLILLGVMASLAVMFTLKKDDNSYEQATFVESMHAEIKVIESQAEVTSTPDESPTQAGKTIPAEASYFTSESGYWIILRNALTTSSYDSPITKPATKLMPYSLLQNEPIPVVQFPTSGEALHAFPIQKKNLN